MSLLPQLREDLIRAAARRYQPATEPSPEVPRSGVRLRGVHLRPRLALAGGVTVVAGLVLAAVFGTQGGGFAPTSAIAAMDGLAHIAAGQAWPGVPGRGQYFYTESTEFAHWYVTRDSYGSFELRDYSVGRPRQCTVDTMSHVQNWVAANGSAAQRTTQYSQRFTSAADRSNCAAVHVTDPRIGNRYVPNSLAATDRPHTAFFPATPARGYIPGIGELPFLGHDWKALSRNPEALLRQLQRQDHGLATDNTPAGQFNAVGDFMSESDAPPSIRSNVLDAAKLIPGIKLMETRTDPTGQTGLAVAMNHIFGNQRYESAVGEELIFDPHTARLLAQEFFDNTTSHVVEWQSYKQPKLVHSAPTDKSELSGFP
jgi:hypothetical protein